PVGAVGGERVADAEAAAHLAVEVAAQLVLAAAFRIALAAVAGVVAVADAEEVEAVVQVAAVTRRALRARLAQVVAGQPQRGGALEPAGRRPVAAVTGRADRRQRIALDRLARVTGAAVARRLRVARQLGGRAAAPDQKRGRRQVGARADEIAEAPAHRDAVYGDRADPRAGPQKTEPAARRARAVLPACAPAALVPSLLSPRRMAYRSFASLCSALLLATSSGCFFYSDDDTCDYGIG